MTQSLEAAARAAVRWLRAQASNSGETTGATWGHIHNLEAALNALPADAEPVAWRVWSRHLQDWVMYTSSAAEAKTMGGVVEPLYAAPPSPDRTQAQEQVDDDPPLADDEIEEANFLGLLAMSNRQLVRLVLHEIDRASEAENELDGVHEQKSDAALLARAEDAEKALAVLNARLGEAQASILLPPSQRTADARAALKEIVACEDLKNSIAYRSYKGTTDMDRLMDDQLELKSRQPLAWAEARRVIAALSSEGREG